MNFNNYVLTEGRSSRPPIGIVPEELRQESQQVVWRCKSKVSIVGNDIGNITLRGTLERVVV